VLSARTIPTWYKAGINLRQFKEVPMPRAFRRLKQLELYHPPSKIPDWKTLPETIREKVLQDLARMFRDRLDQNAGDQKQGGSSNE
jgi:hypothetical protein